MRIALYGAAMRQWGRINPKCLFEDYPSPAGSELAMLGIAKALADRGHQVKVFCDCEPGLYNGVEYYRPELALPILSSTPHDVIVSWADASLFLYPVQADLKVLMVQSSRMGLGQAAEKVDRYFAISRTSAQMLLDSEPYADPAKMWVTRNGVFLERFNWEYGAGTWRPLPRTVVGGYNPKHLVWASSPDRGLHHLTDIFKLVKQKVPDAKLTVAYDFDRAYASYQQTSQGSTFIRFLEKAKQLKDMDGVEVVQHLSQPKLAELFLSAGILAYPCDPVHPTETYCVAVNEALAAGLPVLVSDADCLPENYSEAAYIARRPINPLGWADTITMLMTHPEEYAKKSADSLALAAHTDVSDIAAEWEVFFTEFLQGKETTPDRSLASRIGK